MVEIRAGALSIDDKQTLVGTDSFDVPIPLAGQAKIPEIALYKEKERLGVAKIAAVGYSTADGKLIDSSGPQFGYSHENEKVLLFVFSWRSSDLPKEKSSNSARRRLRGKPSLRQTNLADQIVSASILPRSPRARYRCCTRDFGGRA